MSRALPLVLLVTLALALALAGAAGAATVERGQRVDPIGTPIESYFLDFTASPGEANDVEITVADTSVTFRDSRHLLEARNCEQLDPSTARCAIGDPVTVRLGDGDDRARVLDTRAEPAPPFTFDREPEIVIEAGPGADDVAGGPAGDVLMDGGDGERDRFASGGGDDLVSYAGRSRPVRIDLRARGEDVLEGILSVEGGDAADVLVGAAGANRLRGGPGRDTLRGLGGNDDLAGDAGRDRVFGGPGNDLLSGDTYGSGVAVDLLDGGRGNDLLDLGVEDDEALSIGGPSFDVSPDGLPDTAGCGPGADAVRHPDGGDTLRRCEAQTFDDEYALGRRLRRISRTRVRLRATCPPTLRCSSLRVALYPRGRQRPRLTRPVTIDGAAPYALRLTAAGRRYLRRRGAVTIGSPATAEEMDARVSPARPTPSSARARRSGRTPPRRSAGA